MSTPIFCLLIFLSSCAREAPVAQADRDPWVTAYFPIWSHGGGNPMYPHLVNWRGITHVIHFGANTTTTPPYFRPLTAEGREDSIGLVWGSYNIVNGRYTYSVIDSLRKYAGSAGAKILVSCGGIYGDGAKSMSYILADSARAQIFVDAVCEFARRHGYDGIEFDWEPVRRSEPEADIRAKISLITRLMRRRLDTWSPRGLWVMACMNGVEERYDPALQESVDQYNLMMYDLYITPSYFGKDVTAYNAPLDAPDEKSFPILARYHYTYRNTPAARGFLKGDTGPIAMMNAGIRKEKIGLGLPFYGKVYKGNDAPEQTRVGWPQFISYRTILKALDAGGTRRWDESAHVPWIGGSATRSLGWPMPDIGEKFYITYDDPSSIADKAAYARELGLGGIMLYELWNGWLADQPPGQREPLLDAVRKALAEPSR